jgi:hypothetical protein|tara:strand:- start:7046 stop:7327 length:282 start_codon:yes stop_codon:yes gene_type:complete
MQSLTRWYKQIMEDVERPPALVINDDAPVRRDINSEDMNRIHPEVKRMKTATERNDHLHKCDEYAYKTLSNIDFLPPHIRLKETDKKKTPSSK